MLVYFGRKIQVMGVINVTPDSFSGDGIITDQSQDYVEVALEKAKLFVDQGVDMIDVGGESTRPGAKPVPLSVERDRVIPVLAALKKNLDIPISIDTTKGEIAEEALQLGVEMINDVSGLMMHPNMIEVACKYGCYVVIMHSCQHPAIEQRELGGRYLTSGVENIVQEVAHDLEKLTVYGISHGLRRDRIIIDPGIGYGKTVIQNLTLLKHVDALKALGYPVLMGVSRKSFIGHTANASVEDRLGGSIAANVIAALKKVDIVRVHDVAETVQALKITHAVMELD